MVDLVVVVPRRTAPLAPERQAKVTTVAPVAAAAFTRVPVVVAQEAQAQRRPTPMALTVALAAPAASPDRPLHELAAAVVAPSSLEPRGARLAQVGAMVEAPARLGLVGQQIWVVVAAVVVAATAQADRAAQASLSCPFPKVAPQHFLLA
jgi:hypothetical protein